MHYVNSLNSQQTDHRLTFTFVFGVDANTYEHPKPGKTQGFTDFVQFYKKLGLSSCWKRERDAENLRNGIGELPTPTTTPHSMLGLFYNHN